jgi:hypothetical protein
LVERIARIMDSFPSLADRKRPWLAFVLGFLFSGIALGIYFRSWIDLIVPTVVWLVLIATPGDAGFWLGAVVGGLWGLLRALNSNERLAMGRTQ